MSDNRDHRPAESIRLQMPSESFRRFVGVAFAVGLPIAMSLPMTRLLSISDLAIHLLAAQFLWLLSMYACAGRFVLSCEPSRRTLLSWVRYVCGWLSVLLALAGIVCAVVLRVSDQPLLTLLGWVQAMTYATVAAIPIGILGAYGGCDA